MMKKGVDPSGFTGKEGMMEKIKFIVKKPGMMVAILTVVILIAAAAVCIILTQASKENDTHCTGSAVYAGNAKPDELPKDVDTVVGNLLDEILRANTVTVEYNKDSSTGPNSDIKYKTLSAEDRETYRKMFFYSKGWKAAAKEDITDKSPSNGETISIYDDAGHKFSLVKGSFFTVYTDNSTKAYYIAPSYVADDMIHQFTMPTEEESKRWNEELGYETIGPVYADDLGGTDYKAVGIAWAQAYMKRYLNLSKDHPCYSDKGSVTKVKLIGVSAINHPRSVTFDITLSLHPVNGKDGFISYFTGNCDEGGNGYMLISWEISLENTSNNRWSCTGMGTGGYAGWGYTQVLDTEEKRSIFEEIKKGLENCNGDYSGMEGYLMMLNELNWSEYTKLYGSGSAKALMDFIAANAFGPDQEIRTIYILNGISGLTDEIRPRYASLLKKLKAEDITLFNRCLKECNKASIAKSIMKDP